MPDRISPPTTRGTAFLVPLEEGENLDFMVVEICLGVAKADSRTIHNAEDSELWDQLAAGIADMKARGIAIEFDIRD